MPFVVQADLQTSGRGRSGNQWVSIKGNLLTSIVIPLENVPVRDVGQYSFLTAVALMETLAGLGIPNAQNKWPNDVLVDGKKIAGILLESEISPSGQIDALIIGIGVNIAHGPEGAAWVNQFLETEMQAITFLDKLIASLQNCLMLMKNEGFEAIRQKWLSKAFGLGTDIRVRLPQETFHGRFLGLDEQGALLVQTEGSESPRKIHSGEVFFG